MRRNPADSGPSMRSRSNHETPWRQRHQGRPCRNRRLKIAPAPLSPQLPAVVKRGFLKGNRQSRRTFRNFQVPKKRTKKDPAKRYSNHIMYARSCQELILHNSPYAFGFPLQKSFLSCHSACGAFVRRAEGVFCRPRQIPKSLHSPQTRLSVSHPAV